MSAKYWGISNIGDSIPHHPPRRLPLPSPTTSGPAHSDFRSLPMGAESSADQWELGGVAEVGVASACFWRAGRGFLARRAGFWRAEGVFLEGAVGVAFLGGGARGGRGILARWEG